MIYVTHDQVEAMTLADKVVVLNTGKIEQVGSPLELYHHPVNLFVAGFLGTPKMGFLKGKISRLDSQGCEVSLDAGTRIQLPLSGPSLSLGSEVTLGIRPEHLNLAKPGDCTLTVTADVGERLGSDTYCHVITACGEPQRRRHVCRHRAAAGLRRPRPAPGRSDSPGTGALRLSADFIAQCLPGRGIWLSDPTWPIHETIFAADRKSVV